MEFNPEIIVTETHKLSYRYYNGGKKVLFLFHGFGQTADIFETFIPAILTEYTVITIDLFFHGNSEVLQHQTNFISIEEWNQLFEKILEKHSIHTFSLFSFSIGSRFVFAVLQKYQTRIQRIALIAPDGFGNNFWFRIATSNALCRLVFETVLTYPSLIIYPAKIFNFLKITHSATANFIQRSLQAPTERERIFNTWIYFRKLQITSKKFIQHIQFHSIPLLFAVGSSDELVAHKAIKKISNELKAVYIELPLPHSKMVQAIHLKAVNEFLITNR